MPAGMRAQWGAGGRPSPHKAAGQLFPLSLVGPGPGVRAEVTGLRDPGSELATFHWWSSHGRPVSGEGLTAALDDRRADSVAPLAQEAPRVSGGRGSAQGQAHLHTREAGVEGCSGKRESPQMDLGAQVDSHRGSPARPWGRPTQGHLPAWLCCVGGFHALVCAIRKFSGPSTVLKLVPMKSKSLHLQRRA